MARRWGRRSRWRRWVGRGVRQVLLPLAAAALVTGLIAGGVSEISRSSGPYERTVDLGYARLASTLAAQSAASGAALVHLLGQAPGMDRVALLSALGALASDVRAQDTRLHGLAPPAPAGDADAPCRAAFDARSDAVDEVRRTLLALLGGAAGTAPVDAGAGLAALEAVAGALPQADASWATCQYRLHAAPGAASLAASSWVTAATASAWSASSLGHLVSAVTRSSSLAARHGLGIVAVTTSPPSMGAGTNTMLPPTSTLTAHLVVADQGNVDEPAVQVQVTVTPPAGAGTAQTQTAIVALRAGRSMAVVLGPFAVRPGLSYTVQATAAPPQGPGATSTSFGVQVAEVPTTTTTTVPRTTTTVPRITTTTVRRTTTTTSRRTGAGAAVGG